jgi:rhamnosyltransferase
MNSILAIIICFHPDIEKLDRLIKSIEVGVEKVIIFNNGGLNESEISIKNPRAKIESRGQNVGLAAALNIGCDIAVERGIGFIIAFDQDSNPGHSMIPILHAELLECQAKDGRVVAIGPQLIDERGGKSVTSPFVQFERFGFNKWSGDGVQSVSQLITSGCMIDLKIWNKANRFNDKLFIDYVDNNWCWRIIRKGHIIMGTTNVKMSHEISERIDKKINFSTNTYSPVRRYFQARNAIYHLFYESLSMAQKIYVLKALAVTFASAQMSDESRVRSMWQCIRGVVHGVAKNLGPYPK